MGFVSKSYLIFYNLLLEIGWLYIFYYTILNTDRSDYKLIWQAVCVPLQIFQTVAILEIVHSALGIVTSKVIITTFQISARLFMVWGVLNICPPSTSSIGLPLLIYSWSLIEIVRYGHYFTNLVGIPQIFLWLRYNLFIITFPMGYLAEIICMLHSIAYVRENRILTFSMPNQYNVIFDYQYVILGVLLISIPVFPKLYMHMFAQRRNIFGTLSKKRASKMHRL